MGAGVLDWWHAAVRFEHALQAPAALAWLIRIYPARRFADWSGRSGDSGTALAEM
jgi:hypothetical protein